MQATDHAIEIGVPLLVKDSSLDDDTGNATKIPQDSPCVWERSSSAVLGAIFGCNVSTIGFLLLLHYDGDAFSATTIGFFAIIWSVFSSVSAYFCFEWMWSRSLIQPHSEALSYNENDDNDEDEVDDFHRTNMEFSFAIGVFLGFCVTCTIVEVLFGIAWDGIIYTVLIAVAGVWGAIYMALPDKKGRMHASSRRDTLEAYTLLDVEEEKREAPSTSNFWHDRMLPLLFGASIGAVVSHGYDYFHKLEDDEVEHGTQGLVLSVGMVGYVCCLLTTRMFFLKAASTKDSRVVLTTQVYFVIGTLLGYILVRFLGDCFLELHPLEVELAKGLSLVGIICTGYASTIKRKERTGTRLPTLLVQQ